MTRRARTIIPVIYVTINSLVRSKKNRRRRIDRLRADLLERGRSILRNMRPNKKTKVASSDITESTRSSHRSIAVFSESMALVRYAGHALHQDISELPENAPSTDKSVMESHVSPNAFEVTTPAKSPAPSGTLAVPEKSMARIVDDNELSTAYSGVLGYKPHLQTPEVVGNTILPLEKAISWSGMILSNPSRKSTNFNNNIPPVLPRASVKDLGLSVSNVLSPQDSEIVMRGALPDGFDIDAIADVEQTFIFDKAVTNPSGPVGNTKTAQSEPIYKLPYRSFSYSQSGTPCKMASHSPRLRECSGANKVSELKQPMPEEHKAYSKHPVASRLIRVKKLRPGAQGEVSIARLDGTDKLLIVKNVPLAACYAPGHYPVEYLNLSSLLVNHPNILWTFGCFFDAAHPSMPWTIMLEYCEEGDVAVFWDRHVEQDKTIDEMFVYHFIASLAEAIGFLHCGLSYPRDSDSSGGGGRIEVNYDLQNNPMIHRDIKLENIFMRWSSRCKYGMPDIVLGDFGFATRGSEAGGLCGTVGYLPPEYIQGSELKARDPEEFYRQDEESPFITTASDVYTFGVCAFALIADEYYYNGVTHLEADFCRSEMKRDLTLLRVLQDCLRDKPEHRIETAHLFYLASVWKWQAGRLYAKGRRIPEDRWRTPVADRSHQQDTISISRSVGQSQTGDVDDDDEFVY